MKFKPLAETRISEIYGGIGVCNDVVIALSRAIEIEMQKQLDALEDDIAKPMETIAIEWPEYNHEAMGCGLEDKNITDRYDAMRYGWNAAIDRVSACLPEKLYTTPQEPVPRTPYGWQVQGLRDTFKGNHAGLDAKAEAARVGGTAYAFPIYIDQPAAAAIPAGWKLVPIEPTTDMLDEVDEEVGGYCYSCSKSRASDDDCRRVYRAMLAAAPGGAA